jgi:2-polyprenyl-3-methyl-5-hydroxy-6-metoxy-1,4-benzoquinol methylase
MPLARLAPDRGGSRGRHARRAAPRRQVLDAGCGTGILARKMREFA